MAGRIDLPAAWQALDLNSLSGTVMVAGATDSGKSTFARYLFRRLVDSGRRVVFLDGDPGQTFLGPPGALTAVFGFSVPPAAVPPFPFQKGLEYPGEDLSDHPVLRSFTGSTTPARNLLPMVVGVQRLVKAAFSAGAETLIYDTDGMVEPRFGGAFFKLSLVDLLLPQKIFAIQKERELEAILAPLRKSRRTSVVELEPSPAASVRSRTTRRTHRQEMFARYFAGAQSMQVQWPRLAIYPAARFVERQLIGLEDQNGFLLGLGIILGIDASRRSLTLFSSLLNLEGVDAIRVGELRVDPATFQDELM